MNKVYKVIYSKTRNAFVVVSELVTSHTKAHSTSGMGKKMLSAMVLSSLLLAGPTYTAFAADPVTYDPDNEQRISLNNTDGNGTVIANVANGMLAAASKEAVNGSQLYETNNQIADLVDALNKSNAAIGQAQTDVTRMKTQNITFKSDINTLKTQVATGWSATIDGASVKKINPADNNLNFTAGDDIAVTDPGNGSIKIGVTPTGNVESGNTHVVSGDTVYTAVQAEQQAREAADTAINNKIGTTTDGNYVKASDSVSTNLSTLDTQVKNNADAIAKEVTDRTEAITTITNNLGGLTDSAVQYDKDSEKAKVTLAGTSGTTVTNLKDAALSDSSTDAVTGRQLYAEQQARIDAINSINSSIGTLRGNAVLYDSDAKDLVTFAGSKGTKLTNLKDATLSSSSTDAVTGRQLWTTNENISGFSKQITKNAESLKGLSTSVSNSLESIAAMSDGLSTMDTTKADASLTNLSEAGKIVISEAAKTAVQNYMKTLKNEGTASSDSEVSAAKPVARMARMNLSASKLAMSPAALTTSLFAVAAAAPETVTYDTDNNQRISLNNTDGNGTVIANVANGQLAAASKEAVNGSQLYETNTHISDILDALNKSNAAIGQAQTDITRMKTQNITFKSDINTLKTQVGTGWNATIDGAKVKNINPADNSLNFTAGDDIAVTDPGNGSIKIGVKATGKVEAGNTHIVTGNDVYQAIKDMPTTGSLSGKANTALDNISAAGKKVITDLAQNSVKVAAGTNTRVTETTTNGTKTYTVNVDDAAIQKAVQPKLDEKADKSLGNLDAAGKKVITDLAQNSVKMASGNYTTVTETMENGTKVYAVNVDDKALQQSFQPKLDAKADTNLGNINTAGKKVITDLAQNSVKVAAGTNTRVTEAIANGTKTYTVHVDDASIEKSIRPKLDQKANKDLDNLSDKGKAAIKDAVKDDLAKKANVDASNLSASDKVKWQEALGTGEINETSTGLVTGKTIYEAIKDLPTTGVDGLVKYDKETKTITVAANKDATTVDFSGKDSDGNTIARTVTGIVADANDPTSAANVGYVDEAVGQLAQGVSRVAHELTRDINKVGAGAAALASLHPGEFDPDNKLDFAAGYGHYKGANAGAIAAYYHPNEDTIINVSSTIGNGNPMLSAGVSFKLGSGGNNTLSRTALTKQVVKDQQVIKAMAEELNAMKDKMNQVFNLLDPNKRASFKDVPSNHWAAEAVETLHANDVIEGYEDGEFKGDKKMTRYEYAQMLYKAAQKTK